MNLLFIPYSSEYKIFPVSESHASSTVRNYQTYKEGWDDGEGLPPSQETIKRALEVVTFTENNLLSIETDLCLDGAVLLTIYNQESSKEIYMELTIEGLGKTCCSVFKRTGDRWSISSNEHCEDISQIKSVISNLRSISSKWHDSSVLSNTNILKEEQAEWRVLPSGITKQASQSYQSFAS